MSKEKRHDILSVFSFALGFYALMFGGVTGHYVVAAVGLLYSTIWTCAQII